MKRLGYLSGMAVAASLWTGLACAQTTVYIPDVVELSGPGAVSGTNWRNGVALAIDEINASGGILGRKIETEHLDTQSNPGISRAQIQKVGRDPYVVLGPIYSGSSRSIWRDPAGRGPADRRRRGRRHHHAGQSPGLPYRLRTAVIDAEDRQYLHDQLKVKSVALLWVNNDFGKGGRDSFLKEMRRAASGGSGYLDRARPGRFRL